MLLGDIGLMPFGPPPDTAQASAPTPAWVKPVAVAAGVAIGAMLFLKRRR